MPEVYDYSVLRVVPRVEREEFVNVGVIVACPTSDFLGCRITTGLERVLALAPGVDLEVVARHLEGVRRVCEGDPAAGPVARLPARERFHWLTHPRSAMLQTSAVHSGLTGDPAEALVRLYAAMVGYR